MQGFGLQRLLLSFGNRSTQDERNRPRDCTKKMLPILKQRADWQRGGWQRAGWQRAGCRGLAGEGWLQRAG